MRRKKCFVLKCTVKYLWVQYDVLILKYYLYIYIINKWLIMLVFHLISAVENKVSLKVVHRHGPCSQLNQGKAGKAPSHTKILLQDESRVKSIHSKLSGTNDVKLTDAATLPAHDGSSIGSGNYIVTVGLGTPKKDLSLIFDTGSDLTWTQCQPCARSCYKQKDPIFDPSQSTSYTNISCGSSLCDSLASATGIHTFPLYPFT